MPIPKDILAVARPKNTFVVVYGKNKNLYAVRERLGCKYKEGRRVPVNGRTDHWDVAFCMVGAIFTKFSRTSDADFWATINFNRYFLSYRYCRGYSVHFQEVSE